MNRLGLPLGTVREVEVCHVAPRLCMCVDREAGPQREGYILIDGDGDELTAQPGDRGTVTVTAGGPLGGRWVYKKDGRAK